VKREIAETVLGKSRQFIARRQTLLTSFLTPVDHLTTLWTSKTGLHGGFGGKRSCALLDVRRTRAFTAGPSGPPFDPEGQAPTLWARTSWSTGSEGRFTGHWCRRPRFGVKPQPVFAL